GHVRQFRLVEADLVVLALQPEVTPAGPERTAVNIGTPRGQRASADQLVEVDPQLGKVSECECGAADPGGAVCVYVRMKRHLAGELGMEVPVLVMIGPRCQPPNQPHLLTIEQGSSLSAKKRAGQIG